MRTLLVGLFSLMALAGHAQTTAQNNASATVMTVPTQAISQLENLMEDTKRIVVEKQTSTRKRAAETHPELNRNLVIAAADFVRVTREQPSQDAYIAVIDKGLARIAPLATTTAARQQVADYYLDLMEIVGLTTSEGKLDAFVKEAPAK